MAAWGILRLIGWFVAGVTALACLVTVSALGVLGVDAAHWTAAAWSDIRAFLTHNDRPVTQLVSVTGVIGTVFSGGWAVYKIWHFAEVRMPQRIAEFLAHNDERLDAIRPMLIAAVEAPGTTKPMRAPIAFVGPLNDAMRRIGFGQADATEGDLARAIEGLEKQRATAALYDAQVRRQLAAAHLLRGMVLTAQAGLDGRPGAARSAAERDFAAVDHFSAALDVDPSDADALFYRGLVWARLGRTDAAEADFQKAVELTAGRKGVVRARANYCLAILVQNRSAGSRATLTNMAQAIASLPPEHTHSEEAGEMHLYRAATQERLGYVAAAKTSYQDAAKAVHSLDSRRARVAIAAAEAALRRLNQKSESTDATPAATSAAIAAAIAAA